MEGNPISYLDPFGLERKLYDEIHQAVAEVRAMVSIESLIAASCGFLGIDAKVFAVDGSLVGTITGIIGIATFLADTALTGFDIGVYINEWLCAAWDGDYERMIEINYQVAQVGASYAMSALLFAVDELFETNGLLLYLWTITSWE